MKRNILVIFSLILIFSSLLIGCSSQSSKQEDTSIQTVHIVANEYQFEPNKIDVKPGKIKLVIENKGKRMHGFAIDELNINESLAPGQTIEKVIDVKENQSFEFYCTVLCGSMDQHSSMNGHIQVIK